MVGFAAVVTVGFVAFLSVGVGASVGLVRGTVGLIAGFTGRFSVLRNKENHLFQNNPTKIFTERFSLEHLLINVLERFFPFVDQ